MAFARAWFVPVFTVATLFGGALEAALASRAAVGIGRAQRCDVDPAAVENGADADADDTHGADEARHHRDGLACGPLSPPDPRSGVVRFLDSPAETVALRRHGTTVAIRGPPAHG